MVLCVEVVDAAFGNSFKEFLDAGGYQARERSTGEKEFYRFHKPSDEGFPFMIELFSRKPGCSTASRKCCSVYRGGPPAM